nr:DMT family transporter [Actinomadura sp. CNU-125]
MLLGAAVLGERPAFSQLAGCVLVVGAVWLTGRRDAPPRDVPETATGAEPEAAASPGR